jgi:hypothetical protein
VFALDLVTQAIVESKRHQSPVKSRNTKNFDETPLKTLNGIRDWEVASTELFSFGG